MGATGSLWRSLSRLSCISVALPYLLTMPISFGQPINVEGECADYETEYHDKEQYLVPVGKALYLGGQFVKTCRLGEFATGIHITLVSLFVLWIVLVRHLFAEQHPAESFGVHICKF